MPDLNNKTAIITGGARGIGAAACRLFAAHGAAVAIVDLDELNGQTLASEIRNGGDTAEFYQCDVSRACQVKDTANHIHERFGRIDVLYNNASVFVPGQDGRITDIEEDAWDKILGINLKSIYLFCHCAIPRMLANGSGVIINTASSAGMIGIPNCDAYTASKGATVQLTKSMAVEYGPSGIRCNCIAPAAIQTPMMRQSNLDDDTFDEARFLKVRTPLRRYGTPEEIAKTALFLASDDASYINGAIIVADGGITINGDLSKLPDGNN